MLRTILLYFPSQCIPCFSKLPYHIFSSLLQLPTPPLFILSYDLVSYFTEKIEAARTFISSHQQFYQSTSCVTLHPAFSPTTMEKSQFFHLCTESHPLCVLVDLALRVIPPFSSIIPFYLLY